MVRNYTVHSLEEMMNFAASLASRLKDSDVLLLTGELGSGKTTFTQQLARALGIHEAVTSPTFTIAQEYSVTNHGNLKKMIHVDLYRLQVNTAALDPAVQALLESVGEAGTAMVIEWADRISNVDLTKKGHLWRLQFSHGSTENERRIILENFSYAS